MSKRKSAVSASLIAVLAAALVGCASKGTLEINNEGDVGVKVTIGDDVIDIDAWGGVALYDCTPGDVTVVIGSEEPITIKGPVCPGQSISIKDGKVNLDSNLH